MADFRVVLTGRLHEDVDAERAAVIVDGVRRLLHEAVSVRDPLLGNFEFLLAVPASTENEAHALARAAVTSALFDAGFSRLTARLDDIATRPLH